MRHSQRNLLLAAIVSAALATSLRPAQALIYLPENTLESMLVRADTIVIGAVFEINPAANRGTFTIEDTLKGNAAGQIQLAGVMLQVDTNIKKPRFAKGDRIVVFLSPRNEDINAWPIIHTQTLAGDAEVRTMKGCIAEITPVAQLLADLGDIKKENKPDPVHAALRTLVASKNAYTQIIVGRLMSTRLAQRYKPDGWEDILTPALSSKRKELAQGAMTWAAKYAVLPTDVRATIAKAAADSDDADIKKAVTTLLKQ